MTREPWDQRLDETSAHYRLFVWWRDQAPRPPPSDLALARAYDWSSRAAAWDAVQSLPKEPLDRLRFALDATIEVVALEMNKLRGMSRTSGELVVSPKEIATVELRAFQILKLLQEHGNALESKAVDTTGQSIEDLSDEECRVLLKLLDKNGV